MGIQRPLAQPLHGSRDTKLQIDRSSHVVLCPACCLIVVLVHLLFMRLSVVMCALSVVVNMFFYFLIKPAAENIVVTKLSVSFIRVKYVTYPSTAARILLKTFKNVSGFSDGMFPKCSGFI